MGATADVCVLEVFRRRCEASPESSIYTTIDGAGNDKCQLTARQVRDLSDAVAGFLVQECGLEPGDRAILAYTPSMEFVTAFIGCLRAGVVPVPVPPPDPTGRLGDQRVGQFAAMCEAVEAKVILANREYVRWRLLGNVLRGFRRNPWPSLAWHTTDGITAGAYPAPPMPTPSADDVAFVQFSSGTTGAPKGVEITHRNLHHQLSENARTLELDADTRAVFWVPHFHDLCLITGIVGALWGNGHLYLISPLAFIRDPAIWFDVMSRVKATHTAAPNLAFELAVRKTTPEQRQKWDLSSLKILLTAAEPIRESTVRTFFDAFFCTGLREDAFCPAYGLAEHSAALSVRGREVVRVDRSTLECDGAVRLAKEDADASGTTVIFGCGRPMPGVTVKVVDPETHTPLGEGRVGEIWVNSPSVARGYVELTEATKGTFGAHLAGEADGTAYLRTGDLGFLFRGELFFSGRHQDLIRLGVRSLYPHDVEYAVRDAHPMVRPGCVIACSFDDDGAPGLAVFAEVRADRLAPQLANDIVRAIRQDILAQHGEVCALVWLGRPGSIPKTTSGKLRRSRCRELVQGDCAAIPGTLHVASIGADGPKIRLRRTVEAAAKVCAQ